MRTFRYHTDGTWFKGNAHIHSTASDGGKTFDQLAAMYAAQGYDFLFRTDHWVASEVGRDEADYPLLWLDGIELHGEDYGGSSYHVVCLGTVSGITRDMGFVAALEAARAQGSMLVLAHPHWMANSLEDALRWGFHGVEIYNHVCRWLNGKGEGAVYWSAMLERFPNTLGLAVDDAHVRAEHPGWNGGWIVVNASHRSRQAIQDAMREGRFYSSCGPAFHAIEYDGQHVTVHTSPVQFIRLVGPAHWGKRIGAFDGTCFTEATFQVPDQWSYAYIELEDSQGRRAWTNPLFVYHD
jgi:hypothetical protein